MVFGINQRTPVNDPYLHVCTVGPEYGEDSDHDDKEFSKRWSDSEFIATARTVVPELIAEVEKLKASLEVEKLKALLEEVRGYLGYEDTGRTDFITRIDNVLGKLHTYELPNFPDRLKGALKK